MEAALLRLAVAVLAKGALTTLLLGAVSVELSVPLVCSRSFKKNALRFSASAPMVPERATAPVVATIPDATGLQPCTDLGPVALVLAPVLVVGLASARRCVVGDACGEVLGEKRCI
jgi:hypothetical protein